jgi:hypothetical protein
MKKVRTYQLGRSSRGFDKGEAIVSLQQVKTGDLLIMDSHRFQATNLIRVKSLSSIPVGFNYNYAETTGRVFGIPEMFLHEFEFSLPNYTFFRAMKMKRHFLHTAS